jgi:hypothetical protein
MGLGLGLGLGLEFGFGFGFELGLAMQNLYTRRIPVACPGQCRWQLQ